MRDIVKERRKILDKLDLMEYFGKDAEKLLDYFEENHYTLAESLMIMSLAMQIIGNFLLREDEGLDDYIQSLTDIAKSVKET